MSTSKPTLTRVWASGAPGTNIEDPDVTSLGKFAAGWQAEVPTFQNFNFLQKYMTQGLVHINEQGIPVWDSITVYPVSALAKGSDGNIYKALVEQANNNPTTDTTGNWVRFESTVAGINEQSGTSYSLNYVDAGSIVEMDNASANTVTVEPDSTTDFPIGTKLDIVQVGAGLTSLSAGSGVTLLGNLNSSGQGKAMSLYKKSANTWRVIGGV